MIAKRILLNSINDQDRCAVLNPWCGNVAEIITHLAYKNVKWGFNSCTKNIRFDGLLCEELTQKDYSKLLNE